jgi:hypothetical protein
MCGGALYTFDSQTIKVFFPNPKAKLPVLKRDATTTLLPWGRRREQTGNLPLGGWARIESIKKGVWEKYFPLSVQLPISSFMEKDAEGQSQWFPLSAGQYVQGLIARYDEEIRVYLVTMQPEYLLYDRWSRIVSSPN